LSYRSAICFLVVNQISELPQIAIQSALQCTDVPIYVGFINPGDVQTLPKSDRINLIKLDTPSSRPEMDDSLYQDFSTSNFYTIVTLKWQLLLEILSLGFEFVFYSDIDVFWLKNPVMHIEKSFDTNSNIELLIQSFTTEPDEIRLCMGFVAFRNTGNIVKFIKSSSKTHILELEKNDRKGDDDIVTEFYRKNRPSWIQELPQSTFPVGSMLNLYCTKPRIAGLMAPEPFIFHTNYVIGLRNKRLMLRIFLKKKFRSQLGVRYSPFWRILNLIKHTRLKLGILVRNLKP